MAFLEVVQTGEIKAWKASNSYAEAERTIAHYLAALSLSDSAAMQKFRDPAWTRRKLNGGGDRLHFSGSGNSLSFATAAEPLNWADGVWLTSLQIFRDGLAVARLDDWARDKSAIMLLFCIEGKWRIASEISVTAEHGDNQAAMAMETAEQKVLTTLARFYDAVETRSGAQLRTVLDENWSVKHHSTTQQLAAETIDHFVARIGATPPHLYRDNCRVADVQILHNRLACVRIDMPRLAQTTIFLLCRRGQGWVIAEKAASGGMGEAMQQQIAVSAS